MRTRPRSPLVTALAAGLAGVAALAGCSGSSDGASAPVTVTATATVSSAVTVTPAAPWTAGTAMPSSTAPATGSWTAPTSRAGGTTSRAPAARPPATRRPTTKAPAARPPAPAPATSVGGRSGAAGGVTVPNLVGDSLTAAFARLADLGVPRNRRSPHDVSGKGRTVLQPDNWQVCTQRPRAGTTATALTVYQFGVVKFGERCP